MILDFSSLTRRGLLADLERPAEILAGQRADKARGGVAMEETFENGKTTDLLAVRE